MYYDRVLYPPCRCNIGLKLILSKFFVFCQIMDYLCLTLFKVCNKPMESAFNTIFPLNNLVLINSTCEVAVPYFLVKIKHLPSLQVLYFLKHWSLNTLHRDNWLLYFRCLSRFMTIIMYLCFRLLNQFLI